MSDRPQTIGIWLEWSVVFDPRVEGVWTLMHHILSHLPADAVELVLVVPDHLAPLAEGLRADLPAALAARSRVVAHAVPRRDLRRRAARAWRKARGDRLMLRAPLRWIRDLVRGGYARVRRERRARRAEIKGAMAELGFVAMVRAANAMPEIDVWLVPFGRFAHAIGLRAPKVCIFHDFLYDEVPAGLPPAFIDRERALFRAVTAAADCCITLSAHVRRRHAIGFLGLRPERVLGVPLAPIDRCGVLPFVPRDFTRTAASRAAAADLLRAHCRAMTPPDPISAALCRPYLADFPFEDVDIVVVSTRNRPHKQVRRVVEAVERLVRHEHRHVKLLMTGPFDLGDPNDEIGAYVSRHALQFDVLCLPHLPVEVHTALYHVGAVAVHPSPFEASFPFVFGEAVSVGTPVVLARSAVVAAELDGTRYAAMCCEPGSVEGLCDRLRWALDDRAAALALAVALFEERSRRTWHDVAADYLAVLRTTAQSRGAAPPTAGRAPP